MCCAHLAPVGIACGSLGCAAGWHFVVAWGKAKKGRSGEVAVHQAGCWTDWRGSESALRSSFCCAGTDGAAAVTGTHPADCCSGIPQTPQCTHPLPPAHYLSCWTGHWR
eukprot:scaffold248274_cov21-Tisochrysis_lutea.AAC.1